MKLTTLGSFFGDIQTFSSLKLANQKFGLGVHKTFIKNNNKN
jgi:hypothetical protein